MRRAEGGRRCEQQQQQAQAQARVPAQVNVQAQMREARCTFKRKQMRGARRTRTSASESPRQARFYLEKVTDVAARLEWQRCCDRVKESAQSLQIQEKQHLEKKGAGRALGGAAGGVAEGGRGLSSFQGCARLRRTGKRKVAVIDH